LICRALDAARRLTSPTIRRLSTRMDFQFRDIEVASSLVLHMLPATPTIPFGNEQQRLQSPAWRVIAGDYQTPGTRRKRTLAA